MKLELGEIKCDKCKGKKNINRGVYGIVPCSKCKGVGKLDWIENIVGKKEPNLIMSGVTWLPPSAVKPKNSIVGNAYVDSNTNECYIYDGLVWVHAVSNSTPL